MLEKYLQELGLSDKEAVIYLALLQFENTSVLDLANKTKIKRPTVYVILESLSKKGLVSETNISKKTHYYAEPPERLETYVERKKLALEESQKKLKDLIPEIKSISRQSGEKPVVKYFDGIEGIVGATEEMFNSKGEGKEEIYFVYPRDLLEELLSSKELGGFSKVRESRKIRSNAIYSYKKGEIQSDELGERIKIDGDKYPLTCDIAIYKDNVRINILGKKLSSIFIKSKDVAETLRSVFKLAFDNLKK
jgi:HTH-type transcriptional regulator, sugar sensing transcriptional regulator